MVFAVRTYSAPAKYQIRTFTLIVIHKTSVVKLKIKLVENMPRRNARQLLIIEATGQLINNKARFILCSMCVFFSMSYPK